MVLSSVVKLGIFMVWLSSVMIVMLAVMLVNALLIGRFMVSTDSNVTSRMTMVNVRLSVFDDGGLNLVNV